MHRIRTRVAIKSRAVWQMLLIGVMAISFILVPVAEARRARANGAGNCGNFVDALNDAEDGDVLIPMFDGNLGTDTAGATVTQDVMIEGGWSPPPANCSGPNVTFDTPGDMLAAGFTYGGPNNRGALQFLNGGGPIMTVGSTVKSLQLYGIDFQIDENQTTNGGGMFSSGLSAANLRMDQVGFIRDSNASVGSVSGDGGGLSLDIDNASHVAITDATFSELRADNGAGFNLTIRGKSHVTLRNLQVISNTATTAFGGGGRIIIESGYVTITDSLFRNNSANSQGGALRIERLPGATGPAEVWIVNTRFSGNSAPINSDISVNGDVVVRNLLRPAALPLVVGTKTPGSQIDKITRSGNTYSANFTTTGFTPALPGQHVHFFFDTISPVQAGVPGTGPWFMYGGSSPFNLWGVADRPFGATRMCILVANADHTVLQQSGNCAKLP